MEKKKEFKGRERRFKETLSPEDLPDEPPPLPEEEPDPDLEPEAVEGRIVQEVVIISSEPQGKRHLGNYLPGDELQKFLAKAEGRDLDAIGEENKGHKLLKLMGWKEGKGLGKDGQGRVTPVIAKIKTDKTGVGKGDPTEVSPDDDAFTQYKKRMMLAYKYRTGRA